MWKLIIWSFLLLNLFVNSSIHEWKNRRKYDKDFKRKYYKNSRTTSFEPEKTSFQAQTGDETKYYQNDHNEHFQFENLGPGNEPKDGHKHFSIVEADHSQFDGSNSKLKSAVFKISNEKVVKNFKSHRSSFNADNRPRAKIMDPDDLFESVGGKKKLAAQKMDAENCICVLPQLCDENFFIKQSGEGIINERMYAETGINTRFGDPPKVKCDNVLEICCRFKNAQQQAATTLNTPSGASTTPNTTPSGTAITAATPVGAVTTPLEAATTPARTLTTPLTAATTTAGAVTTHLTAATTPAGAVTTPSVAVSTSIGVVSTPPGATTVPGAVTTVATTPAGATTVTTPTTTNATQAAVTTPAPVTPTSAPTLPTTTATTPTTTRMATTTPSTDQCGISYADTSKEPQAGESPFVTAFIEFPWMLALLDFRFVSPDGRTIYNAFVCGASLLSKDIAMTAAHCIKGREPSSLVIRAGEWNTMFANESLPYQDRSLSRIIIHPEFNNLTLFNDVAILKLDGSVLFANNVQPVCLPKPEDEFFGQNCIATGWGQNTFGPNGRYATKMHKVTLPILNQNECQDKFRRTRLGPFFNFHESFICAGGNENYDTCTGDGGGPLVCKTGNTYTQTGIVSWGIGCGSKDVPGAYVNVPLLKPWIDSTMYNLMRNNIPK